MRGGQFQEGRGPRNPRAGSGKAPGFPPAAVNRRGSQAVSESQPMGSDDGVVLPRGVAWVLAVCRRESERPGAAEHDGLDWDSALAYASRHRLTPAVHWHLRSLGFRGVPEAVRAELHKGFLQTVSTNMLYAELLVALLDRLEAQGVRVISLKGPVAAYAHHGNLAARRFGDLDLLVPLGEAMEAIGTLQALGFVPDVALDARHLRVLLRTSRRELKLGHETGWVVDLHWGSVGEHLAWCPESALWERSVVVDFEGRAVRTLGPVDLALYYCLKVAEDGWSSAYQLLDAGRALEALAEADWMRTLDLARASGKWRIVGAAVALVQRLLGVEVPPAVLAATGREDVQRLCRRALPRLTSPDPPELSFPALVRWHLASLERWRDRACLVRMLTLQPGERDLARLPDWLAFPPFLQAVRLARTVGNLGSALLWRPPRPS